MIILSAAFIFLQLIPSIFAAPAFPAQDLPPSAPNSITCRSNSSTGAPQAQTSQGVVQGVHLNDDVSAFLGIPYARPPIGDLRFLPPQPLPSSNASASASDVIIDASAFGPVCWQVHYKSFLGDNLVETTPQDEDCLTVNVFVPRQSEGAEKLATLMWIYGGSFSEGGGSMPAYDPRNLVASQSDLIVVTINYRMSIFGFPNSPALPIDAQNLGIRDLRAALEWVQVNIAGFGGDPASITLGGESAGADIVAAMAYSHPNNPIARAYLLESGQPLAALGYAADPTGELDRIAKAVGCRNKDDREAELECLRGMPAAELRQAVSNETFLSYGLPNGGSPMIDNLTLFSAEEYLKKGNAGDFAKVPVMMGMNDREGDGVVNWSPKHGLNRSLSDVFTISFFECPIALEASYRTKSNVPIWKYRYFGKFPSDTPYCWLGPYHVAEVPLVLGSYTDLSPSTPDSADQDASAKLFQNAVGAFVKDPQRGLSDEAGWPMFDPNSKTLVELFHDNKPEYQLEIPAKYTKKCNDPPEIPIDAWIDPPPDHTPKCLKSSS